ncbi:MAG: hypothetical protein K0B87_04870 [Candidatus Syntrophosphaera sp.]|nr:hypothetical protein [Candidatus Syntrophosphaera sp.]
MRKFLFLLIVAVIAMGMLLTACEETGDDITNPDDSEWSLFFVPMGGGAKPESHYVTVMWIGDTANPNPSSVSVKVGETNVTLELIPFINAWMGEATVTPGQQYDVKLDVNGSTKVNTTLKIVYNALAQFPANYNPSGTGSMSWTLTADNQSQMASAISFDNDTMAEDIFDHELLPSDRSYVFPVNAVQNYGSLTTYTLEITQMNFKYRNKVMVVSAQSDNKDYGFGGKSRDTQEYIARYCLRLLNHIR